MTTKVCTKCPDKGLQPEENFHWRSKAKGLRISVCKTCWSAYSREHYVENKSMYLQKAAKWSNKEKVVNRQRVFDHLKTHPCVDCGEKDPIVLTFDHVRGTKVANISQMVCGKYTWARIEEEIIKCEVRCANCHTRRTAKQFKHAKLLLV